MTVLDRIKESGDISMAWADEPWVVEGAAVHVSIVGYDNGTEVNRQLNGLPVHAVNANLTSGLDLTGARPLRENRGIAFSGDEKAGSFEISAELARAMLAAPNPDGRSNSDVVRPWINGEDLTQGTRGLWIIDFGVTMSEEEAALYEAPFEYVRLHVRPTRIANRRALRAKRWWIHGEPRPAMRRAVAGLERFLVTVIHSKHRLFVWLDPKTLPTNAMVVFARDDDYFFGVLQSFVHESWARHQGTQLREVESGFRYTANTTFETFPFPQPTETQRNAIASAAKALDTFREGWCKSQH